MRISRLEARQVHGYLPIAIDFYEDLTFLTGLNGSGKTTALRLLMALLTPNIEELNAISFTTATATLIDGDKTIEIKATRSAEGLELSINTQKGSLAVANGQLQLFAEQPHDETQTGLTALIAENPIYRAIKALPKPMFLGLDRRLRVEDWDTETPASFRRREFEVRHHIYRPGGAARRRTGDTVLADVNDLVSSALSEIRAAQEKLDETLRNQILLDSFRYQSAAGSDMYVPSRPALNKFRARQAEIEKAAAGLRLPAGELQSALSEFFEKMTQIADSLEGAQEKIRQPKNAGKDQNKNAPAQDKAIAISTEAATTVVLEWVMNNRQAERILKQIELLDEYVSQRATLHEPIDRFLALTNGFLAQTGKVLKVSSPQGRLRVDIHNAERERNVFALSSGERQIVIMIAHLSLNKRLSKSGIFIVDEPELSLHIGWQEQFVNAIQQANPAVQLILATHSPAIILNRVDNCRSLS
jgi:predicted ATP-binding protein involved in virulence